MNRFFHEPLLDDLACVADLGLESVPIVTVKSPEPDVSQYVRQAGHVDADYKFKLLKEVFKSYPKARASLASCRTRLLKSVWLERKASS
jgi:hypothetical protein